MPVVSRTRATLRSAEFGFFGVVRVHAGADAPSLGRALEGGGLGLVGLGAPALADQLLDRGHLAPRTAGAAAVGLGGTGGSGTGHRGPGWRAPAPGHPHGVGARTGARQPVMLSPRDVVRHRRPTPRRRDPAALASDLDRRAVPGGPPDRGSHGERVTRRWRCRRGPRGRSRRRGRRLAGRPSSSGPPSNPRAAPASRYSARSSS